jgi:hypothetical protein
MSASEINGKGEERTKKAISIRTAVGLGAILGLILAMPVWAKGRTAGRRQHVLRLRRYYRRRRYRHRLQQFAVPGSERLSKRRQRNLQEYQRRHVADVACTSGSIGDGLPCTAWAVAPIPGSTTNRGTTPQYQPAAIGDLLQDISSGKGKVPQTDWGLFYVAFSFTISK